MFRTPELKPKVVNNALMKMADRALMAVPFQILMYSFLVLRVPQFRDDLEVRILALVILANAVLRFGLRKFGRRLLERQGQVTFRCLFALSSTLIGLAWGLTSEHLCVLYGITPDTAIVYVGVLGTAATIIGFSFDLGLAIYGQLIMLLPIMLSFIPGSFPGTGLLSAVTVLYWLYMSMLSLSVHRATVDVLFANEALENKEQVLAGTLNELRSKHKFINALLGSIDQAYLIFDAQGICGDELSARSRELLGMEAARKEIDVVLANSGFGRDALKGWYELLFADLLDFQSTAARGPSNLRLSNPDRILKLAYHPFRDESRVLQSVIVTATDVTREVEAQRRFLEQRERAGMILRINENRLNFRPFLSDCELLIHEMIEWAGGDFAPLRGRLHTMKGLALFYGIESLQMKVNETEGKLRLTEPKDLILVAREQGDLLRRHFIRWRNREMNLFTKLGVFDEDVIEISKRKITRMRDRFKDDPVQLAWFEKTGLELRSESLGELLQNFELHINSVAMKLGKNILFEVKAARDEVTLPASRYREVFRSMIHLFNNSVDHGLESPEERRLSGKKETGSIIVTYDKVSTHGKSWLQILISDDGRGIDTKKIRAQLESRGVTGTDRRSELQLAMHIFDDGFSTKDSVDVISGYGVGMGAVLATVQSARGKISVLKTSREGTVFEVLLPDLPV